MAASCSDALDRVASVVRELDVLDGVGAARRDRDAMVDRRPVWSVAADGRIHRTYAQLAHPAIALEDVDRPKRSDHDVAETRSAAALRGCVDLRMLTLVPIAAPAVRLPIGWATRTAWLGMGAPVGRAARAARNGIGSVSIALACIQGFTIALSPRVDLRSRDLRVLSAVAALGLETPGSVRLPALALASTLELATARWARLRDRTARPCPGHRCTAAGLDTDRHQKYVPTLNVLSSAATMAPVPSQRK